VTIVGTGFTGATGVSFGVGPATTFAVDPTGTQITATSPAGSLGPVDLVVATAGGPSATGPADTFAYLPVPRVTGLNPTTGPIAGGTVVTLSGTGFTGATEVDFGGTAGTGLTVTSYTQLTVTSPAGLSGPVDVVVLTPAGPSATTPSDRFLYLGPPRITGVTPSKGPLNGIAVSVTGGGFLNVSSLSVGSVGVAAFTANSDGTLLTFTVPATSTQTLQTVDISVTNGYGTSPITAADRFTYVPPPTIASIVPSVGSKVGGTSVTITGSNYFGVSVVRFGTLSAVSYTHLTLPTKA